MVMCDPGGIFQDKIDELLGNIDEINIYIDDVLVLFKESFYNHTDQLIFILPRLRAVGLKVNPPKWSFGLKEITYWYGPVL